MNEIRFGKTLGVVALCSTVLIGIGCGSDETKKTNNVSEIDSADMLTDVEAIAFNEVSLNATDVQTLTIFNVGKGDLNISAIKLVEDTLDDAGGEEFFRGDDWVNTVTLATDESIQISVRYTPKDESADTGRIEITSNDPTDADGVRVITLGTEDLAPRIFSNEAVTFTRVPPVDETTRDKFWQITQVQNIGQAPLKISDIVVSPEGSDFRVSYPETVDSEPETDGTEFPTTLAPDESFPVRVYFNPLDDLPSTAELILYSDDPASPEYVVNLLGNSGSPCLLLNHEDEINFGEGGIGFANNKTMIIENCSPSSELKVSDIAVCTDDGAGNCSADSAIFTLKEDSLPAGLPDDLAIIEPQGTASFVLTYTPVDESVSNGELTIKSDDPAKQTLVVPITGKGTNNACPQAVAEATLSGSTRWQTAINTIPLKTVKFRGTNSIDQDGTIERYEWHLVQRPNGSSTQFLPGSGSPEPELFLDLAGDYVVELKVFDDNGTESCGDQALVTIRATPDEDIHIQLVWDTPTDPDDTDTNGNDVDLHFLHPNGTWNKVPYDIFWSNPTNEWGAPGAGDDPSLDIDDTDGAGPENINMKDPEPGLTYAVGVYYYADAGYGPAYATVRIYIQGTREFEYRDMYLPSRGSFWYVSTISWPSADIFSVAQVQQGFPSRP